MGEQPEPNAAEVTIDMAIIGDVVIKSPAMEHEESDDTPEVTIIVKTRGSVAVSLNIGTPEEIADSSRVGHVHHEG